MGTGHTVRESDAPSDDLRLWTSIVLYYRTTAHRMGGIGRLLPVLLVILPPPSSPPLPNASHLDHSLSQFSHEIMSLTASVLSPFLVGNAAACEGMYNKVVILFE